MLGLCLSKKLRHQCGIEDEEIPPVIVTLDIESHHSVLAAWVPADGILDLFLVVPEANSGKGRLNPESDES